MFLPWSPQQYVVVDLPEAIFSNLGLLFLAHTHVPTIWNDQNKVIDNVDWERKADGGLRSSWRLPNGVSFGAVITPERDQVRMELTLRNDTDQTLSRLRTQICVLLKGAADFREQSTTNKVFGKTAAGVQSADRIQMDSYGVGTVWPHMGPRAVPVSAFGPCIAGLCAWANRACRRPPLVCRRRATGNRVNMLPIQIRAAGEQDYAGIEKLIIEAFEPVTWARTLEKKFGLLNGLDWQARWKLRIGKILAEQIILVGEVDDVLTAVSTSTVDNAAALAYIDILAIAPGQQGHGYGREMLRATIRQVQQLGACWVHLDCLATNDGANALYESEGFEEVARHIRWFRRI